MGLNQTMGRVQRWLENRGLLLATEKTKIIILIKRRILTEIPFAVRDWTSITAQGALKYQGVVIDTRLNILGPHKMCSRQGGDGHRVPVPPYGKYRRNKAGKAGAPDGHRLCRPPVWSGDLGRHPPVQKVPKIDSVGPENGVGCPCDHGHCPHRPAST